jgi:hypothetical protein
MVLLNTRQNYSTNPIYVLSTLNQVKADKSSYNELLQNKTEMPYRHNPRGYSDSVAHTLRGFSIIHQKGFSNSHLKGIQYFTPKC